VSVLAWPSALRISRWTLSGNCICSFWSADFGEAAVMTHQSSRRTEMSKPRRIQSEQTRPPAEPHQMSIVFESKGLRGLSLTERTKAIMNLAHILMLAAGIVVEENNDER
jgi:hypothetical protein